ncbi:hypothetical protein PMZ80_001223 [Knufia obscura]|uniref:DUF2293 domain-containing protein n=1 Tax=Knufia obscura TaxID=1635080 RepID=A0ABR0S323_9EURO|nr:hypothetical protein PMZ80_001223 [Knufia obscura]
MGRMAPQRANNKGNAQNSGGVRGAKVQKQRKKHKVVLESAGTKDDDKLRVVVRYGIDSRREGMAHTVQLSFHAEPPPGYTFIPAGNTQLTAAMKAFAKRGGQQIMAVSATPHAQRHELSREVHRIGYHIPTEVVSQVCSHYGIRVDSSGRLIGEQESEKLFMKISQKGEVVLNENIRDQVTINTEAKEIIRDLFPKIPDNDLFQIIKTAFQLGDNRVGTAEEIPLVRRAQLSVVAHIRHCYTNYDKLLRQVPYNEARHMVEKTTLRKLVEWRGDENDKTEASRRAVDDAVREVVVLSDEEESESELEEGQVVEGKDMKVEPVRKPARPEVTTEHRPVSPGEPSSGEDAPQGYRYVPQTSRRNAPVQIASDVISRQQQSRYALWDQVRNEYQSGVASQEAPRVLARVPLSNAPMTRHAPGPREVVYEQIPPVRYVLEEPQPVSVIYAPNELYGSGLPRDSTDNRQARIARQPSPPTLFRGADGKLYERLPPPPGDVLPLRRNYTPPTGRAVPVNVQSRRSASPHPHRPQYHRRTPSMNDDGTIVQSIEDSDSAYKSTSFRYNQFEPYARQHRDARNVAPERHTQLIDLTSSAQQATERMRISQSPPPSPYLSRPRQGGRDVEMIDENRPPRQRQLVDIDRQLATPASSQQLDRGMPSVIRTRDEYVPSPRTHLHESRFPTMHDYPAQASYVQNSARVASNAGVPAYRQVAYEPADDRHMLSRPIKYLPEPDPQTYNGQRQQYYVLEGQGNGLIQPQQLYDDAPSHRIVLDATAPMDGVQYSANPR